MSKRITANIETYEKDGKTKYKSVDIGVILSNQHGEYILLNPTIDLSGVLVRQRLMNPQKAGSSVMCNIWDDDYQHQQQNQTPAQNNTNQPAGTGQPFEDEFDDDIPF